MAMDSPAINNHCTLVVDLKSYKTRLCRLLQYIYYTNLNQEKLRNS